MLLFFSICGELRDYFYLSVSGGFATSSFHILVKLWFLRNYVRLHVTQLYVNVLLQLNLVVD